MKIDQGRKAPAGSFRELWQVALPLFLSSGLLSLMSVIDRIFLTWHSTDALAAAMPASLLHWTVMSVIIGTVTYVNAFVAQYEGANRKDRVAVAVWQGIYLALGAGIAFLAVVPFSDSIFALIGHAETVQRLESDYFSVLCLGTLPIAVATTLSCFYSGRGETLTVMYVNLLLVAINVVLDYHLIFGIGPFPEMGIRGAAVATVTAYVVAAFAFAGMMLRPCEKRVYDIWKSRGFDRELFRRLLRYGLPRGFQSLVDIAGFAMFIFLVGRIGTQELAATNLAFNLNSLAFIPMIGVGTAVMTIVGKRIGEGRPELAVRTTWLAFGMGGVYMLFFAAIFLFLPSEAILYVYAVNSSEAEFAPVSEQVVGLLRFVALYAVFDAMVIIFSSAVLGAGDTRFALVFSFLCGWLLLILPTAIATYAFGGNLLISWWACTAYIIVLGLGFLARFQSGQWKSMRIIEPDDEGNLLEAEAPPETCLAVDSPRS